MMNKNTAILDNTMMDAYLTVTEGVSDNCGIGLAFASLLESAKKNFVNQSNRRAVNASFEDCEEQDDDVEIMQTEETAPMIDMDAAAEKIISIDKYKAV